MTDTQRATLRAIRAGIWRALGRFGFDDRDWYRIALYESCDRFIAEHFDLGQARVLAISSGQHFGELGFENFTLVEFPEFDVCEDKLPGEFDLIIADQVFEHVKFPYRAARNVHDMLAPGGWFLIATPFMVKVHPEPLDCSRWSAEGIRFFLAECGFDERKVRSVSWGNRSYVWKHLYLPWWPRRGFFGSMKNQASFPVAVWAFAQK